MATNRTLTASAIAAMLAVAAASSVNAGRGIQCRSGAQLVSGSYIVTPYCQDQLLAQVAREHGMRASFDRIRWNPNYKREVCRLVGNDIRVSEHCLREVPSFRGGRFR